jgi:NTE family protein
MTELAELVAGEISDRVTKRSIAELPRNPQFLLCATDMVFGVNWVYSHDAAGDYEAGYTNTGLDRIPISHAAAASACFPPVFAPIQTGVDPAALKNGDAKGAGADECRQKLRLTDGGVYDNMGLEPVWKSAKLVLVSDAGGPFEYDKDRGTLNDVQRYPDVMGNQAHNLRRRWLISSFKSGIGPDDLKGFAGTYWRTAGTRASYDPADTTGYPPNVADLISHIRTDLNRFFQVEQEILENHGYLMADAAIKEARARVLRQRASADYPAPGEDGPCGHPRRAQGQRKTSPDMTFARSRTANDGSVEPPHQAKS